MTFIFYAIIKNLCSSTKFLCFNYMYRNIYVYMIKKFPFKKLILVKTYAFVYLCIKRLLNLSTSHHTRNFHVSAFFSIAM